MAKKFILSDTHFGELERPKDQVRAISSFVEHAANEDGELISVGDYVELGPVANLGTVRREIGKVLGPLTAYQKRTGRSIQVVRGNHDPSLTNDLMESELTPGLRHQIHRTMLIDEADGVTVHHGDLVDTKTGKLEHYLSTYQGKNVADLIEFFEENNTAELSEYAKDRLEYHGRNMIFVWDIMRILQKFGVSLDTQLKVFDYLSSKSFRNTVQASVDAKKVLPGAPAEFIFNTWLLNQANAWAVVQGHTHIPSHIRWIDTETARSGVIANTGSIYTSARAPTALILDPEKRKSTLLAFRNDAWRAEDVMTPAGQNRVFVPKD
ncbi:MAG: metallophosphoesterase [Candidatus Abawacabacteria bacterium]|nr:metallophosphoesterase [Candidatus Abawacabacteria bacterium]